MWYNTCTFMQTSRLYLPTSPSLSNPFLLHTRYRDWGLGFVPSNTRTRSFRHLLVVDLDIH